MCSGIEIPLSGYKHTLIIVFYTKRMTPNKKTPCLSYESQTGSIKKEED
jgi:hypothetical protein